MPAKALDTHRGKPRQGNGELTFSTIFVQGAPQSPQSHTGTPMSTARVVVKPLDLSSVTLAANSGAAAAAKPKSRPTSKASLKDNKETVLAKLEAEVALRKQGKHKATLSVPASSKKASTKPAATATVAAGSSIAKAMKLFAAVTPKVASDSAASSAKPPVAHQFLNTREEREKARKERIKNRAQQLLSGSSSSAASAAGAADADVSAADIAADIAAFAGLNIVVDEGPVNSVPSALASSPAVVDTSKGSGFGFK